MDLNFDFRLIYKIDGKRKVADGLDCEDYSVQCTTDGDTLRYVLTPRRPIELVDAYLSSRYNYRTGARVFANGYQSWTTSREYTAADVQKGAMLFGHNHMLKLYGDYYFQKYSRRKGVFHSYSYTYINEDGNLTLWGTTNERTGFTIFHFDMGAKMFSVQKDVEGVTIEDAYEVFSLYHTVGEYDEVFDRYFKTLNFPAPRVQHLAGYTSWYNYYGAIDEATIVRDIDGLATMGDAVNIFQIDDGYQTKTGDWQCNRQKFPQGMRFLSDKIHSIGCLAGLWMAPFEAAKSSEVARQHPDWLIRTPCGRRQLGSIGWGGSWTIDIYIPEAADYVRGCFRRIVEEWGFDMVKLDFLYAVCQRPRHNRSRGQIMCETMDFIRDCVGEKTYILGCAVPLFPAFGIVDMCRITCDVSRTLKQNFFARNGNQEAPSIRNSINNTIFRRHLNGRIFTNDPDVFYLRDNDLRGRDPHFKKHGILRLTDQQKVLLASVNHMFADVLFVSDNVGGYDERARDRYLTYSAPSNEKIIDAQRTSANVISVIYERDGVRYRWIIDLWSGNNSVTPL